MAAGPVGPVVIEAICHAWLGSGTSVVAAVALAGGHYNQTYRLDLSDGTRVVLRVAPDEGSQRASERHLMRNEYASVPFLRPVAALMPTILVADFTHDLLDRDYLIQSWLPGVPGDQALRVWAEEERAGLWRSIGAVLARVHTVVFAGFGRVMGPTTGRWSDYLITTLASIADGCDTVGVDGGDVRRVAELAARHRDVLDQVTTGHLLHGDLLPGNVMVDAHDPSRGVTGLFDCDRTWWGDPAADWTFAAVERLPPDQQSAFWDGYGTSPPTEPDQLVRGLFYRARSLGELRLEHARLGHQLQVARTYDLMTAVTEDLAAGTSHP